MRVMERARGIKKWCSDKWTRSKNLVNGLATKKTTTLLLWGIIFLAAMVIIAVPIVAISLAIVGIVLTWGKLLDLNTKFWDAEFWNAKFFNIWGLLDTGNVWQQFCQIVTWLIIVGIALAVAAWLIGKAWPLITKFGAWTYKRFGETLFNAAWWRKNERIKSLLFTVATFKGAGVYRLGNLHRTVLGPSPGDARVGNVFTKLPGFERVKPVTMETLSVRESRLREMLCLGQAVPEEERLRREVAEARQGLADNGGQVNTPKVNDRTRPELRSSGWQAALVTSYQFRVARLTDYFHLGQEVRDDLGLYIEHQYLQGMAQSVMPAMLYSDLKALEGNIFVRCLPPRIKADKQIVRADYIRAWRMILEHARLVLPAGVTRIPTVRDFYEVNDKEEFILEEAVRLNLYEQIAEWADSDGVNIGLPPVMPHLLYSEEFGPMMVEASPLCRDRQASEYWLWLEADGHKYGIMPDVRNITVKDGVATYHPWLAVTAAKGAEGAIFVDTLHDIDFANADHEQILQCYIKKLRVLQPGCITDQIWEVGLLMIEADIVDVEPEADVRAAFTAVGKAQLKRLEEVHVRDQREISAEGDAIKIMVTHCRLRGISKEEFHRWWNQLHFEQQGFYIMGFQDRRTAEEIAKSPGNTVLLGTAGLLEQVVKGIRGQ